MEMGLTLALFISILVPKLIIGAVNDNLSEKCKISTEECKAIRCNFVNVSDWFQRNCLSCKLPVETTARWTFQNKASLPPNVCVYFDKDRNRSYLKLPEDYISKELNTGLYQCDAYHKLKNGSEVMFKRIISYTMTASEKQSQDIKPYEKQKIKCPFEFCTKKYTWKFSYSSTGPFGKLPKNTVDEDKFLLIKRMSAETRGYYQCSAEIKNNPQTVKSTINVKLDDKYLKQNKSVISVCDNDTCAIQGQNYGISCYGTIRNSLSNQKLIFSCSENDRNMSFKTLNVPLDNGQSFSASEGEYRLWGKVFEYMFEVHLRIPYSKNINYGKTKCNLVLSDVNMEHRLFMPCFQPAKITYLRMAVLIGVGIVVICMIILIAAVSYRYEYEIRYLKYRTLVRIQNRPQNFCEPKIVILYARDRLEFANDLNDYLKTSFPKVTTINLYDDGLAGEDVGVRAAENISTATTVIVCLDQTAFDDSNNGPNVFKEALRQSFDQYVKRNIHLLYILFQSTPFIPPDSFDNAETLRKDLSKFSSRDRKVICSNVDKLTPADKDNLFKRLRLMLPIPEPDVRNSYIV